MKALSELEIAERLKSRNIEMLSYGGRTRYKSKFKCLVDGCGFCWETSANSVLIGYGCKKCAGLIPLDEREAYIRLEGRQLSMLKYGGSTGASSLFRCLVPGCNFEWSTAYRNVQHSGKGCPKCAGKLALSLDDVIEGLAGRQIDILKYAGTGGGRSKFMCTKPGCGHTWVTTAADIINGGKGCAACALYGFSPSRPAHFYAYKIRSGTEFLGFGITNNPKSRSQVHAKNLRRSGAASDLLFSFEMSGYAAQALERRLKQVLDIVDSGVIGFKTEATLWDSEMAKKLELVAKEASTIFQPSL